MTSTFSTDYIDPEISKSLSPEYKLRPLQLSDYESGYLDVLSDLTAVGNISKEMFAAQVEFMRARSGEYFGIVIEKTSTGKVVAVGTLLVEHKLYVLVYPLFFELFNLTDCQSCLVYMSVG